MKKMMITRLSIVCSILGVGIIGADDTKKITSQQEQRQMIILNYKDDIVAMSLDVKSKLDSKFPGKKWAGILAISRGGLVPAGILSQHMGIRRIECINVESYGDNRQQGQLKLLSNPNVPEGGKDWLVVDDLSDSGKTLRFVNGLFPEAYSVVLMVKPKGKNVPHLFSREYPQDVWIHFPWEPLEVDQKEKVALKS
jgi:xanthine phosphoribosyltransferase